MTSTVGTMTKLILIPLLIITMPVLADHPTVAFGNDASDQFSFITNQFLVKNTPS
jgi:hypothetical protein